ncbi:MAG: hypothetical protein S4CHLAM2_02620 [Chlamydiales bacterium]|nr:hypothetical protein [Chlamydiales bacterium]
MPAYSFRETLGFFSDKLDSRPPEKDIDAGEAELLVDQMRVGLSKDSLENSLKMEMVLGFLMQPIREERFKQLATSNFLGINTAGCTLTLGKSGDILKLHVYINSTSTPQESWEWLHRLLHVAVEWKRHLIEWEEFVPLSTTTKEKTDEQQSSTFPRA